VTPTIGDIMTRHVVTVGMDATLGAIHATLERYRFHHVLVVDESRLAGVISDRDLLRHLSPFIGKMAERRQDLACLHRKAHQIMSRDPVTATTATPVHEACGLILAHRVSCLPVVGADRHPLGIVTWRDLLRWSMQRGDSGAEAA
jgi:acetoin utilization protein AcuB